MKRREFLNLSTAFGAMCFTSDLFAKDQFIIYGAPALPSVIIATASLKGELAKQSDFSLKIWKTPDQLRAGVSNKEYKVMASPSNVAANLKAQGQNIGMVNILTKGINSILVKDANIKSLYDLTGKKIIVPFKNDMPDIILKALCKKLKIDISKINITYASSPVEAVGMFLLSSFDATYLPEPMASVCILKAKKTGLEILRGFKVNELWAQAFDTKPILPQAGIIADTDFYKKNEDKFDLLHKDLTDALKWIKQNPSSAAEIGSNYLPASVIALQQSIKNANLTVEKAKHIKDEILNFFEIIMQFNPKLIGGKMPDESLFL